MNERIKELYEQSGIHFYKRSVLDKHYPDLYDGVYCELSVEEMEKFAELIVKECVEQIQICSEQIKNDDGYADDNIWPIMQSIVDAVAIDVKEHFGVES